MNHGTKFRNMWELRHYREGELIHQEKFTNVVVDGGLDDILDKYYKGSAYTATFYVGLTDDSPTVAATDTMASHAGWAESTVYSGNRATLTLGTVASQSVDNAAAVASFSITDTDTVGGAFIATDSTKGGTTPTLIAVAAFSGGDRDVINTDVLEVTTTLTSASA